MILLLAPLDESIEHTVLMPIIEWLAFTILTPVVLGALATALAMTYICMALREKPPPPRGRAGLAIRAVAWTLFAASFFTLLTLDPLQARALLKISAAFLMLNQLAYLWADTKHAVRRLIEWPFSKLKSGFRLLR